MDRQFVEDIVADVRSDYERRVNERRQFEAQWQLNANFVAGNQYCRISVRGDVEDTDSEYVWQEREVYNHIATILETRLAKLSRVRPKMSVMPASGDDGDVKSAKMSSKILASAQQRLNMSEIISKATLWSELCGTAFYKITWDSFGGKCVGKSGGKNVREGDVRIDVCPPFEVLPDSLICGSLSECSSIIHAKALHVSDIKRIWGKDVGEEAVDALSMSGIGIVGGLELSGAVTKIGRGKKDSHALVLERYTLPNAEKPEGELAIVAGDQLLYYGELPYKCGIDGERGFPFVEQRSITRAGCFYGSSMVERAIPIQRAFNAVKNRKHEFMNRIAMGVLAVEDGSVDTENLETEGLSPGKILVYRQGSTPPRFMSAGSVPSDFTLEEQRLLEEFVEVSGISEIMRSSSVPSTVSSGTAIQLLVEQDDTRISTTAENIRAAIKAVAQKMLRMYRQFATYPRLSRFAGDEGEVELITWTKSSIDSDEVIFETENEINSTAATRRSIMLDLLKTGLLYDENGRLSADKRHKILDTFGYGGWESTQEIASLHVSRAQKENEEVANSDIEPTEVDDHELHIAEHVKHFLSSDFADACKKDDGAKARMLEHIRAHKRLVAAEKLMQSEVNV